MLNIYSMYDQTNKGEIIHQLLANKEIMADKYSQ